MGCGRVGATLAKEFQDLGHTVAVIDQDREAFRRLGADFNGQTVAGILSTETPVAITLTRSGNQQTTLNRTDIAELHATGISLMPEGFEQKLSRQDLADLIQFIRTGP